MPQEDAPAALKMTAEAAARTNAKMSEEGTQALPSYLK